MSALEFFVQVALVPFAMVAILYIGVQWALGDRGREE